MTLTSEFESELLRSTPILTGVLKELSEGAYTDVQLVTFGPFEAPVYRVDNRYRMRMVIKCKLTKRTLAMFSEVMCTFGQRAGRRVTLGMDFNPSNL